MTDTPQHILVAEDYRPLAAVVHFNLTTAGFRVTLAKNGREALKLAQENDYDLVMADYGMPEMVGTELFRQLRRDDRYAKTPLILVSALCNDLDLPNLSAELKLAAIFWKPFDSAELVATIREYLTPDVVQPV